ncbi:GONST5 [Symbiodinium necroappetens]|uniref:GONST5 protein n=1 Tax=Symbiodinium necroappetens TaxID=1628268 RepID=A0A812SRQ5_9DINO|nr:GONST5 [Symbiodinium necroappetens]
MSDCSVGVQQKTGLLTSHNQGGFASFQLLSEGVILPHWVALVFTGSIFAGIAYAYRSHGLSGVAVVSTQVMAIMAVQLSTKLVLQTGFVYPTCIAAASLHFLCVWLASWAVERRSGAKDGLLLMDLKSSGYDNAEWYVKRILPIAVLQTLNVVLNTCSLLYIGAGFNAIIGILCPVLTALVSATLGARITSLAWAGMVTWPKSDAVISIEGLKNISKGGSEPLSLAVFGMSLGVGALFARSVRSVLMDCQMNEYAADKACPRLKPTQVVALASPAVFVLGFALTLILEGWKPYMELLLAFSTACAVYLSLMGMVLIKMLGAAAAQIAGKLNILVTVALSSAFLHERLSLGFIVGAAAVLAGAAIFEHAKARTALCHGKGNLVRPPLPITVAALRASRGSRRLCAPPTAVSDSGRDVLGSVRFNPPSISDSFTHPGHSGAGAGLGCTMLMARAILAHC